MFPTVKSACVFRQRWSIHLTEFVELADSSRYFCGQDIIDAYNTSFHSASTLADRKHVSKWQRNMCMMEMRKTISMCTIVTCVQSAYHVCRWKEGCVQMMMVMMMMLMTYTVFFAWRANLDIDKPLYRGVVSLCFIQLI